MTFTSFDILTEFEEAAGEFRTITPGWHSGMHWVGRRTETRDRSSENQRLKLWKLAHPEQVKEWARAKYLRNRAHALEYQRIYHQTRGRELRLAKKLNTYGPKAPVRKRLKYMCDPNDISYIHALSALGLTNVAIAAVMGMHPHSVGKLKRREAKRVGVGVAHRVTS